METAMVVQNELRITSKTKISEVFHFHSDNIEEIVTALAYMYVLSSKKFLVRFDASRITGR